MINDATFNIESVCLKSLPCQHNCTVIMNGREITTFRLKADEIGTLYDLYDEKVFYSGENGINHFKDIPQYVMRSQDQFNKLKEKTKDKIEQLISKAIHLN